MELEELKRSWEQYDKKLTENLRLNEELLRRSNLDRSKREMNTPLAYLSFCVASTPFLLLFAFRWTVMYGQEPLYLICGIITMIAFLFSFVIDLKGIGMLRRIDYYNTPILEQQKQLNTFNALFNLDKKVGLYILPILLLAVFILANKGVHKFDILDYPKTFIITTLVMISVSYPLMIWIYRSWFEKKVKAAQQFLSELQEFEKEEE